jgi:chromosomal replication initiator protein
MSTELVIWQDEATRWGPYPREAMITAHKARERRLREADRQAVAAMETAVKERATERARRLEALRLERIAEQQAALARYVEETGVAPEAIQTSINVARGIVRKVAIEFQTSPATIFGRQRDSATVRARHTAIARVAESVNWSLPRIGRFFKRDHTTILHALRKFKVERFREPATASTLES